MESCLSQTKLCGTTGVNSSALLRVCCESHMPVFFPPLNKNLMRHRLFSSIDAGKIDNDYFPLVKGAGRAPFVDSARDIKMCNHIRGEGDRLE